MIVLSTSIQSLDYVAQKEAFSFIVRINVSDTMYELCFDLFMGTFLKSGTLLCKAEDACRLSSTAQSVSPQLH